MVSTAQGWEAYVRVKLDNSSNNWSYNATIPHNPYFTSSPFESSVDMTKIYVIGTRTSVDTVEGVIDLTGSIERPYFDTDTDNQFVWNANMTNVSIIHYTLADVCGLYGTNVSKCAVLVRPVGTTVNLTYTLWGVKFHDYAFALSSEETLTETASFTIDNVSSA